MDPQACLERWRSAIADDDKSEARAARLDLASWLRGGGFWPTGLTGVELGILKRYDGLVPPTPIPAQI